MEELIFLLKNEPKIPTLVSLMHVNNELGNITNIEQIGEICNQYGAFLDRDAVQLFGFMPLKCAANWLPFFNRVRAINYMHPKV